MIKDFLYRFKPGIIKEYLLLVAGFVWLFAGSMLIGRGSTYLVHNGHHRIVETAIASLVGLLFYILLFMKISFKHISRIKAKKIDKPCVFSFFDFKGYLMMGIMIAGGVILRHMHYINPEYLYTFYIGMGIPLILSSLRFFSSWRRELLLIRCSDRD